MAVIKFIGDIRVASYTCSPFSDLMGFLDEVQIIGFDTETNMATSILDRVLKVLSLTDKREGDVWVVEWEYLNPIQQKTLLAKIKTKLCVIQNVSFDYQVLKKYGTVLEKVWCTMLGEMVLNNGVASESTSFGLQAIYMNRFGLDISKDEQKTFGEGPYDDRQIQYAAIDVLKLCKLYEIQRIEMFRYDHRIKQAGNRGMYKTMWWENEFVKCVGDMESTGIRIHKEKWYNIEDSVLPRYKEEFDALNRIAKEQLWDILVANDWVSDKDTMVVNVWSSAAKKKVLLDEVYNFPIEKTAKTELKKYLQENDPSFPPDLKLSGKAWEQSDYPTSFIDNFAILKLLILQGKDTPSVTDALNGFLMVNLKNFCIEQGWLRPAGEVTLNWGSPVQRLKIFQAIDPKISSTAKDVIIDLAEKHEIVLHYLSWAEVDHQLKSFGKPFYDKHVCLDGKHRTRFNQILATGRLSSVSPNLLNIPRKHSEYRAAIIPDPGFDMIDADYDGQELIIVAILAQEKSWLEYMKKGYDIHSKNAELIFEQEWVDATEPGCAYYGTDKETDGSELIYPADGSHPYKKCECKVHVEMRDNSKAVSFGSIYGISFIKLAFNLKISEERAKFILRRFFEVCPAIREMMDKFGEYALRTGHIIEPVFGRIRFFDKWKLAVPAEHGAIERAAFNTPIQSSGSAILKIAFVLMRRWLKHKNYDSLAQLLLPYHDETLAQSKPEVTAEVRAMVQDKMMLAARLAGFDIKASAKSGASWLETH